MHLGRQYFLFYSMLGTDIAERVRCTFIPMKKKTHFDSIFYFFCQFVPMCCCSHSILAAREEWVVDKNIGWRILDSYSSEMAYWLLAREKMLKICEKRDCTESRGWTVFSENECLYLKRFRENLMRAMRCIVRFVMFEQSHWMTEW